MDITRNFYNINSSTIPVIEITPSNYNAQILLLPSYGGCKEEILGFGFRLAEDNYKCICVDLRGHGENQSLYDEQLLNDVNKLVDSMYSEKPTIVIGHSLGGRIALLSNGDIKIGISPALEKSYSEQTMKIIKNMRQHRVRECDQNINFIYLSNLPYVNDLLKSNDLIVYCKKDVPEIVTGISNLRKFFNNIVEVDQSIHSDIFLNENLITAIKNHLEMVLK
jgi:esterase/lipase